MRTITPRVTIGLPVYNGERYIAEALKSLVEQDFADIEILVADNASTDSTVSICEQMAADDDRIRILPSDVNRGIAWNHNRAVEHARGEYFKWAACDDRYRPSLVSACIDVLERNPDVVLCFTNTVDIDDDGQPMHTWPATNRASSADPIDRFRDVLINERQCFPIYGVIRSAALRSSILEGAYPGSDHPLLADLALRGRFVEIPEVLFEHREHAGRSMAAFPSARRRLVLFRPGSSGAWASPRWAMAFAYLGLVARAPLPIVQKLRLVPAFASWAKMWWRPLVFEPLAGVRDGVRPALSRFAAPKHGAPSASDGDGALPGVSNA